MMINWEAKGPKPEEWFNDFIKVVEPNSDLTWKIGNECARGIVENEGVEAGKKKLVVTIKTANISSLKHIGHLGSSILSPIPYLTKDRMTGQMTSPCPICPMAKQKLLLFISSSIKN